MARLIAKVRAEFGRAAWLALIVPGLVIVVVLFVLAMRQALSLTALQEMHGPRLAPRYAHSTCGRSRRAAPKVLPCC